MYDNRGFLWAPCTVFIAGPDTKNIIARVYIGKIGTFRSAGFIPCFVKPFQFIGVGVLLRRCVIKSGIAKRKTLLIVKANLFSDGDMLFNRPIVRWQHGLICYF